MIRRAWMVSALVASLLGCAGHAGNDGGGAIGGAPIERTSYCASRAQHVCEAMLPCVSDGVSGADVAPTMDGCVADQTDACNTEVADREADGQRYDPQAAGDCMAALNAGYDGCFLRTPTDPARIAGDSACARVFVGAVPTGGPCLGPRDCAPLADGSSAECLMDDDALSGECVSAALPSESALTPGPTADGGACDDDDVCASTLCFLEACTPRNLVDQLTSGE